MVWDKAYESLKCWKTSIVDVREHILATWGSHVCCIEHVCLSMFYLVHLSLCFRLVSFDIPGEQLLGAPAPWKPAAKLMAVISQLSTFGEARPEAGNVWQQQQNAQVSKILSHGVDDLTVSWRIFEWFCKASLPSSKSLMPINLLCEFKHVSYLQHTPLIIFCCWAAKTFFFNPADRNSFYLSLQASLWKIAEADSTQIKHWMHREQKLLQPF